MASPAKKDLPAILITPLSLPGSPLPTHKRPASEQDFRNKFKTELCRNWEDGICPFSEKCTFAHGDSELRDKTHLSARYKTKQCRQFFSLGFCSYGHRCQFIHSDHSGSRSTSPSPSPSLSDTSDLPFHRLPVFVNLESLGSLN